MKPTFNPYNPDKLYDIILLLAGENTEDFPRSNRAIGVFKTGKIGGIFVTGGYGGFEIPTITFSDGTTQPKKTGGELAREYLLREGIEPGKLFLDEQSRETLGNFAFPADSPETKKINGKWVTNPHFDDLKSILLITEQGHMKRSLQYAEKVIHPDKMDYLAAPGPYSPGILAVPYNFAMLRALHNIKEPDIDRVLCFLNNKHPFYEEDWLNKPVWQRQAELALTCFKWYFTK